MNLIPAGTSKRTGKSYQAFWACPNKCKAPYKTNVSPEANKASNANLERLLARLDDLETYLDQVATDVKAIREDLSKRP